MRSIDRISCKIFLFGLPVVFLMALAASAIDPQHLTSGSLLDRYNSISGLVFGAWMALALYLSLRLIFSYELRDQILPRLAFFAERDEREILITGRAARNSFLTTLALLILFLCLSAFQIAVYRVPPELARNGNTGTVTLGLDMNIASQKAAKSAEVSAVDYFRYTGLPFSNFAVILILIFWQLGTYNYFARRLARL